LIHDSQAEIQKIHAKWPKIYSYVHVHVLVCVKKIKNKKKKKKKQTRKRASRRHDEKR
jgi:hypothetical protein